MLFLFLSPTFMSNANTLKARVEGETIVLFKEGQEESPAVRHNLNAVLQSFGFDMRQLLSTFEYSSRIGLPLDVATPESFGAQMRQNKLYDEGRTSDDDRFDD
jgi:hypothetical protein